MLTDENDYCLVEAMGTACMGSKIDRSEICEKALNAARINAAEGTSKWFLINNPSSKKLDLYRHSQVIEDKTSKRCEWSDNHIDYCCQVKIKARVIPDSFVNSTASSFQIYYMAKIKDENEFISIQEGALLRSGDRYKIVFQPDKDSYVYVFQLDSSGKLNRLFPMIECQEIILNNINPVKKGLTYHIPARDGFFELDNNTGEERFYFIVSEKPNQYLENIKLDDSVYKLDDQLMEQFSSNFRTRGFSRIIMNPKRIYSLSEGENVFSTFDQRLERFGANCVNMLNFQHK